METGLTRADKKGLSRLAKRFPSKVGETKKIANSLSGIRKLMASAPSSKEPTGTMPSYKKGGVVKETGPALVHKGERVIPKRRSSSDGSLGSDNRLINAHLREMGKNKAEGFNIGHGSSDTSIGSKTSKGYLTSTIRKGGITHEWND